MTIKYYVILIHYPAHEKCSGYYGITFPRCPRCCAAGTTLRRAMIFARQNIKMQSYHEDPIPIDINNKNNELIKALTECDREKYPNVIGAMLLDVKD